jgi:outer membrane protein
VSDTTRTLRRFGRALALGALAFASVLAPAQLAAQQQASATDGPVLTLQEALALAREQNPDFQAQLNDIDVARWQVRSARANLLPSANLSNSFGYTASGERRFESVGFGVQPAIYSSGYDLGASLDINGSKLLQPTVARANMRATEQRIVGAAANLESTVAQQYLAVLRAQETVSQAEREVARTAEHVRLAQARLDVGAGTPLDVRRAEVQQGQAEISRVNAENNYANAILALSQTVGTMLPENVRLASDFAVFEPQWQAVDLVALAERENPNLQAARASADASSTAVRQARSSYLPSLRLSVGTSGSVFEASTIEPFVQSDLETLARQRSGCLDQNVMRQQAGLAPVDCADPADPAVIAAIRSRYESQYSGFPFSYDRQPMSARMTISLPLFTGLTRQLQVEQARASAMDARHQVRAQELRLQTDVATALRNLQTAYRTVHLQEVVRTAAAEELRLAEERFRFGAASSIEVTDAQTRLSEAERSQIDAVYNFHQSLAALEAFVGRPLR